MLQLQESRVLVIQYKRVHLGPWDQRVCLIPDGDFFNELVKGTTDVVTDHIEKFTENGILLQSGVLTLM